MGESERIGVEEPSAGLTTDKPDSRADVRVLKPEPLAERNEAWR